MYKIMVVEDDEKLQNIIKEALERYDYSVYCTINFKNIEDQFSKLNPHLVLLDVNLPYYDGFYFCRIFRRKSNAPVLFISARNEETHQIMGMEMGADDYITKPFSTQVLIAKVNAAIRRCYGEYAISDGNSLDVYGLRLDEDSFKISYKEAVLELSKNEFKLLKKLLENADKIVSREELLEELWDDFSFVDDNTLTVNVTRVKTKLGEIGIRDIIKTKRGIGYLMDTGSLKGNN
ncbi:MAG: response regulator [Oscillospiraceae bacterium]|nr:response regulator [Oscillospiraceae bacterium]